jgi:hypothetical protein
MKIEKRAYIAPTLTVVTFKSERGYCSSQRSMSIFNGVLGMGQNASEKGDGQEMWTVESYSGSGWSDGGW